MSAMFPATAAALVTAVQASPDTAPPSRATTTLPVTGPGAGPNGAATARTSRADGALMCSATPRSPLSRLAATVSAFGADPDATKVVSPESPAAVTTATPASVAAASARAVESLTLPNGAPSATFTTSRWSAGLPSRSGSTGQSSAWTVSAVVPVQPSTRSA